MSNNEAEIFFRVYSIITETAVGGGDITISLGGDAASGFELLYLSVGPDTYGAARAFTWTVIDDSSKLVYTLLPGESISAVTRVFPFTPQTATVQLNQINPNARIVIMDNLSLTIKAAALAQNETITVNAICKLLRGAAPTYTITDGGTGTHTVYTPYNSPN